MALETGTYISDLNASNPVGGTDLVSTLDDHIRLVKSTIKNTFPNVAGAVTPSHTELGYVAGVTSAIQTQINAKATKAGDTYTGTHDFSGATAIKVPTQTAGDNTTNAASTAFVVATSLNANLPGQTGNAGKYITTNGSTASWATPTISKSFQSAEQTITTAGALTIAHGMGVIPQIVLGYLKCVTGENGYSAGDVLCVPLGPAAAGGLYDLGVAVVPDATNLNVRYGNETGVFPLLNKTTGVAANMNVAHWTFSLRAFA